MEAEVIRRLLSYLAGTYVFVATVWAILIPAIRQSNGRGAGSLRITLRILVACFVLLIVGAAFLSAGDQAETNAPHWTETLIVVSMLIAAASVAFTFDDVLYKLSRDESAKD